MRHTIRKNDGYFQPKVAVIIVNWNGKADTLACLESVRDIDYPCLDVIVVDNDSTDDSVVAIRDRFPDVVLLEAEDNGGTAGGRNIGIRYALKNSADFVLFLDNDTVVDSHVVMNFLKAVDVVESHGILGAKIYYFDEPQKIWYAGTQWTNHGFTHLGCGDTDDGQRFNAIAETAYACGCALFVDKTVLEHIGILDERFYCYFEETDFCYRAAAAGFRSFVVPSARVWHKISASSGGAASPLFYYFINRNVLLWAERHLPLSGKLKLYIHTLETVVRVVLPPRIGPVTADRDTRLSGYELLRSYTEACRRKYRAPSGRATLLGVRDYLLRRFGNCPDSIRSLGKS